MQRIAISPFEFLLRILGVCTGLVVIADVVAYGFRLHFSLVLFIIGILAMFTGNLLVWGGGLLGVTIICGLVGWLSGCARFMN